MKSKMMARLTCDGLMTVALLLLMAYEMVGEKAHEWIGTALILLFLLHHFFNVNWSKRIFKGAYTPFRIFQTLIAAAILVCMLGLAFSGVLLSRYVFAFLSISGGKSLARTIHMLCSYWGFTLMGVHLGLHWSMLMDIVSRGRKQSTIRTLLLRILTAAIAAYGISAFVNRQLGSYMLLKSHFVFFDYEEPLVFFFLDYIAVMGLFVFIGHYLSELLKWCSRKREGEMKQQVKQIIIIVTGFWLLALIVCSILLLIFFPDFLS